MIGWIVLGLFVAGIAIIFFNRDYYGDSGETRMSKALVSGFGFILVVISVVIALGAGLWQLF